MADENQSNFSLTPTGAHEYTTTTMSAPQLEGLTSRWLLKMLPWVQARGGIYRVNRVETYDYQQIEFVQMGDTSELSSFTLTALPILRGFYEKIALAELAKEFKPKTYKKDAKIVTEGANEDHIQYVIKSGSVKVTSTGKPDEIYGPGFHFGGSEFKDPPVPSSPPKWPFTVTAISDTEVLTLTYDDFEKFLSTHPELKVHIKTYNLPPSLPPPPPPYPIMLREYPLAVEQSVLSIPTRVADLYNDPMNQTQQQLKLVVERIREVQENRMINDPEFGLLNNIEPSQRIHAIKQSSDETNTYPTPYNLDRLVTRHRNARLLLAHPRTISAIGRRASQTGVYPESIELGGHRVPAWRGIPLLPCTKIKVDRNNYSSILVMRTGEDNEGVIGLTETGLPDEYEPGLNVRFMGVTGPSINDKKEIVEPSISYLVSAYFSVAVLVPSALGVLDNVYVGEDPD